MKESSKLSNLHHMSKRSPQICVVGAGVAGLRCAEVLLELGVKVTILEARDRVGGRVSGAYLNFVVNTLLTPFNS